MMGAVGANHVPIIGAQRAVSLGFVFALKGVPPDAPMRDVASAWLTALHIALPARGLFTLRSTVELGAEQTPAGVAPPDIERGRRLVLVSLVCELHDVDPRIPRDGLNATVLGWLSIGIGLDDALAVVSAKEISWSEYEALLSRVGEASADVDRKGSPA